MMPAPLSTRSVTTVDEVHTCTDYQDLTTDQQNTLIPQCTASGGKVSSYSGTETNFVACADDGQVGSCEVGTGSNIKQVMTYYSDNGYTQDQAAAACAADNGDFKD
jgi:hypothetical protein